MSARGPGRERQRGHGRKDGRAAFALPDTIDLESVNAAQVALIRRAAEGQLTAREALDISRMLEHRRRAIASATLWQKMQELEAQGRQITGDTP